MTAGEIGGLLAGAGLALALLLVSAPASAAAAFRLPNARGHRVAAVPALFPAIAVIAVAAVRSVDAPERVSMAVVALAGILSLTGLMAMLAPGREHSARGLSVGHLLIGMEAATALVIAAALTGSRAGAVAGAAALVGVAASARAPWPPAWGSALAVVAFAVAALVTDGSHVLTVAPGVGALAVLVPLEWRGRLVGGRAAIAPIAAGIAVTAVPRWNGAALAALAAALFLMAGLVPLARRLTSRTHPQAAANR